MCTGWCPLAAEWGNWAEWANVVAAAVVGFAVWRVSKRTADLAAASNKINESLEALELQRDGAVDAQKKAEETLILIGLRAPLGGYLSGVEAMRKFLSSDDGIEELASAEKSRSELSEILKSIDFEIPESTRSRMHYLSVGDAGRILRAETAIHHWLNTIVHIGRVDDHQIALDYSRRLATSATNAEMEIKTVISKCIEAIRIAGLEDRPSNNDDKQPLGGSQA